ncbi:MAG: metalloregulator ArsR/SmtB family transcription factor [Acidobacteriota bacterium]
MSKRHDRARRALAEAAVLFAALGDPTRLALVHRLSAEGPQSIARLSDGAGVTRQAITKHLEALAEAGLAHDVRAGRERIWELETGRLAIARRELDRISAEWDAAIGRLQAFVEEQR